MAVDPIFRVRRLALAAILTAGGEPRPDQYRRAALEPFDQYVTPWGEATDQRKQWPSTAAASSDRPRGPQF